MVWSGTGRETVLRSQWLSHCDGAASAQEVVARQSLFMGFGAGAGQGRAIGSVCILDLQGAVVYEVPQVSTDGFPGVYREMMAALEGRHAEVYGVQAVWQALYASACAARMPRTGSISEYIVRELIPGLSLGCTYSVYAAYWAELRPELVDIPPAAPLMVDHLVHTELAAALDQQRLSLPETTFAAYVRAEGTRRLVQRMAQSASGAEPRPPRLAASGRRYANSQRLR